MYYAASSWLYLAYAAFIFELLRSWRKQSPETFADSYQIIRRNIREQGNFTVAIGKLQILTTVVGTVSKVQHTAVCYFKPCHTVHAQHSFVANYVRLRNETVA